MAEQKVLQTFAEFDEKFALIAPGEVKKMNEVISLLSGVAPLLNEVGSKDAAKGNELADGFNGRMKKVETLSKQPAPAKPPTIVKTSTTVPGPTQTRVVQTPKPEPTPTAFEVVPDVHVFSLNIFLRCFRLPSTRSLLTLKELFFSSIPSMRKSLV